MKLKTATLPDGRTIDYHYADFERRHVLDGNGRACVEETTTYWRTICVGRRDPVTGEFVETYFS
jgi:hypothetical protein